MTLLGAGADLTGGCFVNKLKGTCLVVEAPALRCLRLPLNSTTHFPPNVPAAQQISSLSGCSVYSKPIFNSVNYNSYSPTLFGPVAAAGLRRPRGVSWAGAGAQAVPAAVTARGRGRGQGLRVPDMEPGGAGTGPEGAGHGTWGSGTLTLGVLGHGA